MKKILVSLVLLLVTLSSFANNTILIIGDSLSAGYGIDTQTGWVALLQKRITEKKYTYTVINASISGDTTSNGLARLPNALKQHQPSITIIELGANDGLRGLSPLQMKMNLQKMISLSKQAGSKVLILGLRLPPNYGPDYTRAFQQVFLDVSKYNKTPLVPLFLKNIDDDPSLMQADQIHPTDKAQEIILDNVWPELEKLLIHTKECSVANLNSSCRRS